MHTVYFPAQADRAQWRALRQRVGAALAEPSPRGPAVSPLAKALILAAGYAALALTYWGLAAHPPAQLLAAAALGLASLPLILNVGHAAVHGHLSREPRVNHLFAQVFALLGTSRRFWTWRHLDAHHATANVAAHDLDIAQSSLVRLSDDAQHRWYHRAQHVYMPALFLCYTLHWFVVRDFVDLARARFGHRDVRPFDPAEVARLLLAKVWHFAFLVAIPAWGFGASWADAALAFLVFHLSASAATTFVLVSTHVGDEQEIITPEPGGRLPYGWLEHHLRTTADFATDSTLALHVFGGFNHHVAHHLFPEVEDRRYPCVTAALREFCLERDLPYRAHDSVLTCAASHLRRLRRLARRPAGAQSTAQ